MKREEKVFQAETKELLQLMINSIYTNKEIFLRELISNGSDAIDKIKFNSLTDDSINLKEEDLKIEISIDKENRLLTITDAGIGMTYDEINENIGTIARSGSKIFKEQLKNVNKDEIDIIGQFGVGFYSGFIVADKITILSRSYLSEQGVKWESTGDGSYSVEEIKNDKYGTAITLHIKEGEDFDEFLDDWKIKSLVKKYSDYIRYKIVLGDEVLNSTKPIWKIEKSELKDEDYNEFYKSNFHDWQEPLMHFHIKTQGNLEYTALIYVPKKAPFDFHTKNYKKGLQLYTKNVFIMDKCEELVPEYFNFLTGLLDCDNLSLNISREILQQNSELKAISRHLEKKIITEFEKLLKNNREKYIELWEEFGRNIKFGVQEMFGVNKEKLQDLIIFKSSFDDKYSTLKEYVDRMGENNEILYVSGEDLVSIKALPKMEVLQKQGREVLILTDKVDEFTLSALGEYEGKKFKSINDSDFKLEENKEKEEEIKKLTEENQSLIEKIKKNLENKVENIEFNVNIGDSPSALLSKGTISLEMEKVLSEIPGNENVKATKILAINPEHPMFNQLKSEANEETFSHLVNILYNQALILEGFPIDNPVEFIKDINLLLVK